MLRLLRTLILIAILAALLAAGLLLYSSRDPAYIAREWVNGSQFWAYDDHIRSVSAKHGLDPMLIKAVVWRESTFRPEKVGTSGERGLMQVTEPAAQDWAKAEKVETFVPTDLFDPRTNIEIGAWYLARALERWKGRADPIPFALAEYNAGRSRVDRWVAETNLAEKAEAPDLLAIMDFPTTKGYIAEITRRYRFYKDRGRL